MSSKQIALDSGFRRLVDEGYNAEVREQHLLVHDIPYVNESQIVQRATIVCTYVENADTILPPDNHQVWWTGSYPCFASGTPIEQIRNEDQALTLFPGCEIKHRFSNKPDGTSGFVDHYSKLTHYILLIQSQAASVVTGVDARNFQRSTQRAPSDGPFEYADTASARSSTQTLSAKFYDLSIAIVGLGGTGAYLLDQVAKTPVAHIHLFDGDVFQQHNAFRSPGAASTADFSQVLNKATYFRQKYSAMHRGVLDHSYFLSAANIDELTGMDFVFVCVDRGDVRRLVIEKLISIGKPFIDVGLNLQITQPIANLIGTSRVTLGTAELNSHIASYVPMDVDVGQDIYHQNIQVADMNALNAVLAAIRWKQFMGFYRDDFGAHNLTFSVNSMSLVRDIYPT